MIRIELVAFADHHHGAGLVKRLIADARKALLAGPQTSQHFRVQAHLRVGRVVVDTEVENRNVSVTVHSRVVTFALEHLAHPAREALNHLLGLFVSAIRPHHGGHVFSRHVSRVALRQIGASAVSGLRGDNLHSDGAAHFVLAQKAAGISADAPVVPGRWNSLKLSLELDPETAFEMEPMIPPPELEPLSEVEPRPGTSRATS